MSKEEEDWDLSGDKPAKKKGGIPKWLLFGCGGGCLLATVATIVLLIWGVGFFKDLVDPEQNWPKLALVLPFDERPTEIELQMGMEIAAYQQYVLHDRAAGLTATVMAFEISLDDFDREEYDKIMSPGSQGAPFGLGEPVDAEAGEMELQGRTIRTLGFRSSKFPKFMDKHMGAGLRVDLSGEDSFIMVELRRDRSKDLIGEEEVQDFFAPFDVWRGR